MADIRTLNTEVIQNLTARQKKMIDDLVDKVTFDKTENMVQCTFHLKNGLVLQRGAGGLQKDKPTWMYELVALLRCLEQLEEAQSFYRAAAKSDKPITIEDIRIRPAEDGAYTMHAYLSNGYTFVQRFGMSEVPNSTHTCQILSMHANVLRGFADELIFYLAYTLATEEMKGVHA